MISLEHRLVGRHQELKRLDALAARCRAGDPQIVCVSGPPEVGKASLARAFLESLRPPFVFRTSPPGNPGEPSLEPIREILAQIPLPAGGHEPVLPDPNAATAAEIQAASRLLRERLQAVEARDFVVWVIAGVEGLDHLSQEVIAGCLRSLPAGRLLVLMTTTKRPHHQAQEPLLRLAADRLVAETITLEGLDALDLQELILDTRHERLTPYEVNRLRDQCDGIPGLCIALLEEFGRRALSSSEALLPAPRAVLAEHRSLIGALSPGAVDLLQAVAVLGGDGPTPVCAQLIERDSVDDLLSELVEAELVTSTQSAVAGHVTIARTLLRNSVYFDIPPEQRRALHRRAALVTSGEASCFHRLRSLAEPDESEASAAEQTAIASFLATSGGDPHRLMMEAGNWSEPGIDRDRRILLAAALSAQVGRADCAAGFAPLLVPVDPDPWRSLVLGIVSLTTGDMLGAARHFEDTLTSNQPSRYPFLDSLLDAASVASVNLGTIAMTDLRPVDARDWVSRIAPGGIAVEQLTFFVRIVEVIADAQLHGTAKHEGPGRPDATLDDLAGRSDEPSVPGSDATDQEHIRGVTIRQREEFAAALGIQRLWEGQVHLSCSILEALVTSFSEDGRTFLPILALASDAALRAGQVETAITYGRQAVKICVERGMEVHRAVGAGVLALAYNTAGEFDRARRYAAEARYAAGRSGTHFDRVLAVCAELALSAESANLAHTLLDDACAIADQLTQLNPGIAPVAFPDVVASLAVGDVGRARQALGRWEPHVARSSNPWVLVAWRRLRGLVGAAQRGQDPTSWEEEFDESAKLARVADLQLELGRTVRHWGESLVRHGDTARGQRLIADASDVFQACGAFGELAWLNQRRVALGLGGSKLLDRFSELEREVAVLAGSGMSNRQIASKTGSSPKSVENALARVYGKAGVRSKTELALLLSAHGIV